VNFWLCQRCFTDAKTDTPGRFETADNGTVFLDEIGNIPLHLQSKLLHVLQTRKVTRLGESKPRNLNVRIISATNSDIKEEVENKTFEDLLYVLIPWKSICLLARTKRRLWRTSF
jgi:transcriptional regulator with GAF, ATPase, and Fis domain